MANAEAQRRGLVRALSDIGQYSQTVIGRPLRRYQLEIAREMVRVVDEHDGRDFVVIMPRQSGKNELSSQFEAFTLARYARSGGQMIKCAPTFRPQIVTSIRRLEGTLNNALTGRAWVKRYGYVVELGRASLQFLSAALGASVVGATANRYIEADEAQDVDPEKFDKDFRPMGASGNASRIYYGTPWADDDLLGQEKARAEQLQQRDGRPRLYQVPWERVAAENPLYGFYVEGEIERLGRDHPLIRTQYLLELLARQDAFLSPKLIEQLQGDHEWQIERQAEGYYVAGIDVAGADEEDPEGILTRVSQGRDSTVVLIGHVLLQLVGNVLEPITRLVAVYAWRGTPHRQLYPEILRLLRNVWACQVATVDATGVGGGLAAFLGEALGPRIIRPYVYTAQSKSTLAYGLITALGADRLKLPGGQDVDGHRGELLFQCRAASRELRANQVMIFKVPESRGHDDYLNALALLAQSTAVQGRALGRPGRRRVSEAR